MKKIIFLLALLIIAIHAWEDEDQSSTTSTDEECVGGRTCIEGHCACVNSRECDDGCVDIKYDVDHCGECHRKCPVPANGQAVCISGACSVSCYPGYTNCGGACVNGQTDPNNCCACANKCPAITNGQAACNSGQCGISCNSGYTNCNGACVNGQTDPNHCGTCTNTCNAYQYCDGACVCTDSGVSPPSCTIRTINFSDVPAQEFVPNCYQSFYWTNFFIFNNPTAVANYFPGSGTISRDTPFTIISIDVTTQPITPIYPITFTAYRNGVPVGLYATTSSGTVTFPDNTFSNIDSISVLSDTGGEGEYYDLTNLKVCA